MVLTVKVRLLAIDTVAAVLFAASVTEGVVPLSIVDGVEVWVVMTVV